MTKGTLLVIAHFIHFPCHFSVFMSRHTVHEKRSPSANIAKVKREQEAQHPDTFHAGSDQSTSKITMERRRQRSLLLRFRLEAHLHIWRAERSSVQSLHSTGLGAAGIGSSWGAVVWSWGPASPRPHQLDAPAAWQQIKPGHTRNGTVWFWQGKPALTCLD